MKNDCILPTSIYFLKLFKSLHMTEFRLKHVAQLDTLTYCLIKIRCVEPDIDLFIHIFPILSNSVYISTPFYLTACQRQ
jgi:hypothetical protein